MAMPTARRLTLVSIVVALGLSAVAAMAWHVGTPLPSTLDKYAAAVQVEGYRRTQVAKNTDFLIATYWVGPPAAQDLWSLSREEADAVVAGRLDLLAAAVDSC